MQIHCTYDIEKDVWCLLNKGKSSSNSSNPTNQYVMLVECKDLLPQDVRDMGYPQHQAIRAAILEYWKKDKNVHRLWTHMIEHMDHIS